MTPTRPIAPAEAAQGMAHVWGWGVTRVLKQRSGRWSICCTVPDCTYYIHSLRTEPEARRLASHHDAQHRRSQR